MRRLPAVVLSLLLATALHVDWHLARPEHHRLSLDWSEHWVATAIVFALVACLIAQRWTEARWQLGTVVFVAAVVMAQGIEPMLEVLLYERRLGYSGEPERWAAFWRTMLAATPAYWLSLWVCARRATSLRAG